MSRRCPRCRYPLGTIPDAAACPECGLAAEPGAWERRLFDARRLGMWIILIGVGSGAMAVGAIAVLSWVLSRAIR